MSIDRRSSISFFLVVSLAGCNGASVDRLSLVLETPHYDHARVATLNLSTGALAVAGADLPDSDTVPVRFGDTNGLLLRTHGQLAILGADGITIERTIELNDSGSTGANPNAVLSVSPTKAYVARTGSNSILVIDPTKSGTDAQLRTIDLSSFLLASDMDGKVDAAPQGAAVIIGTRAYVALARSYYDATAMTEAFAGASLVAVIDTATDALVDADAAMPGTQAIELGFHAPIALAQHGGSLVVASSGDFGVTDGGIELVDVGTFSATTLVTEVSLGGDLSQLTVAGGRIVAVVSDVTTFDGKLITIDAATGTISTPLVSTGARNLGLAGGDDIAVAVGATVKIFDVGTGDDVTPTGTPAMFDATYTVIAGIAN